MRSRTAFFVLMFILFIAAICAISPFTGSSKSATAQPEAAITWKSSVIHVTPWLKLSAVPKKLSQYQLVAYQQRLKPAVPPATTPSTVPSVSSPSAPPPTSPTLTSSPSLAASSADAPLAGGMWSCIEQAESSDRPYIESGLYGILVSTWRSLGYSGVPGGASIAVQNQAAMTLYARYGWRPWNDPCTNR